MNNIVDLKNDVEQKKAWCKPVLISLNVKNTGSGNTEGTPEDLGYDPVIS